MCSVVLLASIISTLHFTKSEDISFPKMFTIQIFTHGRQEEKERGMEARGNRETHASIK